MNRSKFFKRGIQIPGSTFLNIRGNTETKQHGAYSRNPLPAECLPRCSLFLLEVFFFLSTVKLKFALVSAQRMLLNQ